jgi:hypothetical protein
MKDQKKVEIYRLLTDDPKQTVKIRNPELLLDSEANLELEIHSFEEEPSEALRSELTDYISNNLYNVGITKNLDKRGEWIRGCNKNSLKDVKKRYEWDKKTIEELKISNHLKFKGANSGSGYLTRMFYGTSIIVGTLFAPIVNYFIDSPLEKNLFDWKGGAIFGACFAGIGAWTHASSYISTKNNLKALTASINRYESVIQRINNSNIAIEVKPEAREIYSNVKENSKNEYSDLNYKRINDALVKTYAEY